MPRNWKTLVPTIGPEAAGSGVLRGIAKFFPRIQTSRKSDHAEDQQGEQSTGQWTEALPTVRFVRSVSAEPNREPNNDETGAQQRNARLGEISESKCRSKQQAAPERQ